jgi:hypothetical protein
LPTTAFPYAVVNALCGVPASGGPERTLDDRPAAAAEDHRDDNEDQENKEENLRDISEVTGKAAKAEYSGDQGKDSEDEGPTEHGSLTLSVKTGVRI